MKGVKKKFIAVIISTILLISNISPVVFSVNDVFNTANELLESNVNETNSINQEENSITKENLTIKESTEEEAETSLLNNIDNEILTDKKEFDEVLNTNESNDDT